MAVGLTLDLKLDQHPDLFFDAVDYDSISYDSPMASGNGAAISRTERLAYLGCYYLSTRFVNTFTYKLSSSLIMAYSIVLPFNRPNTLPFTQYMQFCVDCAPIDEIDTRAYTFSKYKRLAEQANELNKSALQPDSTSLESKIEFLLTRLDSIQQSLSSLTSSHRRCTSQP